MRKEKVMKDEEDCTERRSSTKSCSRWAVTSYEVQLTYPSCMSGVRISFSPLLRGVCTPEGHTSRSLRLVHTAHSALLQSTDSAAHVSERKFQLEHFLGALEFAEGGRRSF